MWTRFLSFLGLSVLSCAYQGRFPRTTAIANVIGAALLLGGILLAVAVSVLHVIIPGFQLAAHIRAFAIVAAIVGTVIYGASK